MLGNNPNYQVVMVGHGLGGGMAALYTLQLNVINQFPNTSYGLITFGQMRVGNKNFADYMNDLAIPMNRVVAR
jgi:predicted lipase